MSWRELEPRASRLWTRFAPRRWPACERPYVDLAERRIVWPAGARATAVDLPALVPSGDVALLPPSGKAHTREKEELFFRAGDNSIVLDQRFEKGSLSDGKLLAVRDLLENLLARSMETVASDSAGAIVLAPLVPGLFGDEGQWMPLLASLAGSSPRSVVGLALELAPVDRRRIVDRLGEQSFESVHHSGSPVAEIERRFARAVAASGLEPFFDRPAVPGLPPRAERNRRIAAVLFEAGERWLALARGEADGASLLAAARHVESATQEIEALARERQLALLPWLSPLARRTIEELVEGGKSPLLADLRAEWTSVGVAA